MELIISLLTIIANLFLGISVYKNNPKSATNRLFFLLTSILVTWSVTNYISVLIVDPETAIFWIRIVMATVASMFLAIFLLAHTFPEEKIKLNKLSIYAVSAWAMFLVGISLTPLIFSHTDVVNGQITPVPGPAIPLYGLNVITFLIASVVTLIRKIKHTSGSVRTQTQFMLLGLSITFILSFFTTFIFVVVLKNTNFVIFGPVYSLFLVGVIAYAIIKHRFLDIRLVVARSVAYTLLVLILGIFYSGGLIISGRFLIRESTSNISVIISTFLALVIAFSFQPLLRILEKITDNIFYKDTYDQNTLLGNLSHIMASTYEISELSSAILKEIIAQIKFIYGYLILTKNSSIIWVKSTGKAKHPEFDEEEINHLIKSASLRKEKIIIFEEEVESIEKETLRKYQINIVLPLIVKNETIGAIILSEKSSGEIYSVKDINVLEIIAPEIAIAINNALSYDEIRRFNITLQEEVDRATKDLQNANIKLQELDKLKDEFVSLASHELRTPMTAIKGSLSTILEGYAGNVSDKSRDFLTSAYNENDRLIRLVNNLLNISRIEAGRFTFNITKVDLNAVISEVVDNLQMAAKEKSLFLKYGQVTGLPLVYADLDKVKEVVINLVGNAIKFTHKGGITVKCEIKDGFVQSAVTDTGSGISKEDQELLFKKFSQARGGYSKQAGGTGLGLYISKQIIEGQKGKIWLESVLGQGSTFYFTLPVVS